MNLRYAFSKEIRHILEDISPQYGELKKIRFCEKSNVEILTIDFVTSMIPQYPVFSIEKVEPIDIYVSENQLPIVVPLRDNFPTTPHLNTYNSSDYQYTISLCLFDTNYHEIKHKLSAALLLKQIDNWFSLTSKNLLHREDQPLEPFFFGSDSNVIILNMISSSLTPIGFFRDISQRNTIGISVLEETESLGEPYLILYLPTPSITTDNIIRNSPETIDDLFSAFPDVTLKQNFLNILRLTYQECIKPKILHRIFSNKPKKLDSSKVLLITSGNLVDNHDNQLDKKKLWELRAYLLPTVREIARCLGLQITNNGLVSPQNPANPKNISIRQYNIMQNYNSEVATLMSGATADNSDIRILQIGVGALGSQVATNANRSGFGIWTYVDNDLFWPHNISRHILNDDSVGSFKVDGMKLYSNKIRTDSKTNGYTLDAYDTNNPKLQTLISNSMFILDTSASIGVSRNLAIDFEDRPRIASSFLNASGDSSILLLENSVKTFSLDILEMEYYKFLINNQSWSNHLKTPESISFSHSCRDISFILPQENMALFAAIQSKAIQSNILTDDPFIGIWTLQEDLSVTFQNINPIPYEQEIVRDWTAKISSEVLKSIHKQRTNKLLHSKTTACSPKETPQGARCVTTNSKKSSTETGGVLIGSYDLYRKIIYVVDLIQAPNDSISSPNSFIRGYKGLSKKVKKIEDISAGNLTYIGEWHSHPSSNTQMSSDDSLLLAVLSTEQSKICVPACMIIVGEKNHSIYIQ